MVRAPSDTSSLSFSGEGRLSYLSVCQSCDPVDADPLGEEVALGVGDAEGPGVETIEGVAVDSIDFAGAWPSSATFFSRAISLDSCCWTRADVSLAPWQPKPSREHDRTLTSREVFITALFAPIVFGPLLLNKES